MPNCMLFIGILLQLRTCTHSCQILLESGWFINWSRSEQCGACYEIGIQVQHELVSIKFDKIYS